MLRLLLLSFAAAWAKDGSCTEATCSRALLQRKTGLDQLMNVIEHIKEEVDSIEAKSGELDGIKSKVESIESKVESSGLAAPSGASANRSALFQGCAAGKRKFQSFKEAKAKASDSAADKSTSELSCAGTVLRDYSAQGTYQETCCPEGSFACAGCAKLSGSSCSQCGGGFLMRSSACTSCASVAGWVSRQGLTCAQLGTNDCDDVKVKGLSSNEACCKCGGGHVTATPFSYEVKHWALGSTVSLAPSPRTAQRYSLNEGCELADYNLTMDGATGVISSVGSSPQEAFSLECTVTAHQAPGVTFEAPVRVAMDWFAYGVPLLLFPKSSPPTFQAMKAAGTWESFQVTCAPSTAWLVVNAATGDLTRGTSTAAGAVGTEDVTMTGQTGGVCVVTAQHMPVGTVKWQQRTTKVVALWPQPWASLSYEAPGVSVTLGEQLPVLKPVVPSGEGLLKPSDFYVACTPTHSLGWAYDELLGAGLLEGYSLLEVSADGEILISPPRAMSAIFDALISTGGTRKKVSLSCSVFGTFPDQSLSPVVASLSIDVLDDVCWVPKSFRDTPTADPGSTSEVQCRQSCRQDAHCSSFKWTGSTCQRYVNAAVAPGNTVTAMAKVTDCTAEAVCMEVNTGTWYQSGLYCPVAPDLFRNDVLYLKEGLTPEETLYLSRYVSAVDGAISGCSDGQWILRQAKPKKDYILADAGHVELAGPKVACMGDSSVSFGVASCSQPNISSPEEGVPPMLVDDPFTSHMYDFHLHPCECAPEAWGMNKPVNPESFESVPSKSQNQFVPPAFELVAGQFVCPARYLLDAGVFFETDTEAMERSDCEAHCKADVTCDFFWQGNQQGSNTCRLYSACPHLVRELGLDGKLHALPRSQLCQVADPEACFATTLRRGGLAGIDWSYSYSYWKLHQQCDEALLLGGGGVETCAKPTYRPITSHTWLHKRPLPESFVHGTRLDVSCWYERYSPVNKDPNGNGISVYCVNGKWFNYRNEPELGTFSCEACVQVGSTGYKDFEMRNEQELWFFNRMQLKLFTEVLDNSQTQVHCLKFGSGATDLVLTQQSSCGNAVQAEFLGITSTDSRHLKLLESSGQCLEEAMSGTMAVGVHETCSPTNAAQQIPTDDLPAMLWRMHTKGHEEAGHRLKNSVIDCSGRGAVGKVDMQHLFNTNPAQTEAFVGRVKVPVDMSQKTGTGAWVALNQKTSFGWTNGDYPAATKVRICLSYSDSSTSTRLQVRMTDASFNAFFSDSFGVTWSNTGLFHHTCGAWHNKAGVTCGYGWGSACKLQVLHGSGIAYQVQSAELEFATDDPSQARAFRGRMDVPATYSGTATANSWSTFNSRTSFGLATWDYPDASKARVCVAFTDSSSGGALYTRLTTYSGSEIFQDNLGGSWSNSGLIHWECGSWRPLSNFICGYGWGTSCKLQFKHTQSVNVVIWYVNIEFQNQDPLVQTAYIGRLQLDVSSWLPANPGSWQRISQHTGLAVKSADYPTATEVRTCVSFVDDSAGGSLKVRIRRTDSGGGTVFMEDSLLGTWSRLGLVHMECGSWRPLNSISCGSSWSNTCQVDALTTEGVNFGVWYASLEFRASLPRDVCRFAPVYAKEADDVVEIFKIGSWPDWQYFLADAPVYCPEGKVLTDLNATTEHLHYSCGSVAGLGSCIEGFSPQADVKAWSNYQALGSLQVACPTDALLNGFHFEFSEGGNWMRFRYTCCKAAGAPMVLSSTTPTAAPAVEGMYCADGKDASGRPSYKRVAGGGNRLSFYPITGRWCIGGACAPVNGAVSPVGLQGQGFDVVAMSDFDGQFEGKGIPKMGGSQAGALKSRLRAIKTPKRPKAPRVPTLEGFTVEEPTYAAECMDYSQLWNSIQESYKDASGVVQAHMNQLNAEPVYDLPETNPCAVAGAVSGKRGKIGGGDGRATPEKMDYTELDGCAARVITRELEEARLERDSAIFSTVTDVAYESIDLICDIPPNVETAPMGVGAEFQPEEFCGDASDLTKAMLLMGNFQSGIGYASALYNIEYEDNQDCDPIQAGLDRLFCDIHCVRDAVVRGDRTILRNLKQATDISNNNMKKMVEWSVAANRAETGWLAAKMDTIEDRLGIRIQLVQDALTTANTAALVEAKQLSESMLQEITGFADAAGSALGRHSVKAALAKFAAGERLEGPVNTTRAKVALGELAALHATLQSAAGTSKMQALGAQIQREASQLQSLAQRQLQTLGVYKEHSNASRAFVQKLRGHSSETRGALVEVDKIWWELRNKVDGYLDAAQQQVSAFQASLQAIAAYETCGTDLGAVQTSYAKNLAARDLGHAQLRSAWRDASHLFGELAAVLADGEVFEAFVRDEGCHSSLARQTLHQARLALRALKMLAHRFEAGGLPKPDGTPLVAAARRIQRSFKAATAC